MGRSAGRLSGILVATSPEFCWPSDRNFVSAYRENLMAAGTVFVYQSGRLADSASLKA
jgi:hypothetical protein